MTPRITPTPKRTTEMRKQTNWSDTMYMLQEILARARMRRAPSWRSLPYRPARSVAAGTRWVR